MARRIDAALLNRVGRPCTWERSIPSLNRLTTGHIDWTSGTQDRGYTYADPVTLKCLFTSDNRNETFDVKGAMERGTCSMTFKADLEIQSQDRIVMQDLPITERVKVTRSATTSDVLPCRHVVEIIALETATASYTYGADFLIDIATDGTSTLRWIATTPPATATLYYLTCTIKPVWIVADQALVRSFGAAAKNQLLKRVTLQRDDQAVRRA